MWVIWNMMPMKGEQDFQKKHILNNWNRWKWYNITWTNLCVWWGTKQWKPLNVLPSIEPPCFRDISSSKSALGRNHENGYAYENRRFIVFWCSKIQQGIIITANYQDVTWTICWIPPANWMDKAKSIIPDFALWKAAQPGTYRTLAQPGATGFPDGTAMHCYGQRNTWVNISTFTVVEWTWSSHITDVKLHSRWLRRERYGSLLDAQQHEPSTDRRWAKSYGNFINPEQQFFDRLTKVCPTLAYRPMTIRFFGIQAQLSQWWTSATKPCKPPKRIATSARSRKRLERITKVNRLPV